MDPIGFTKKFTDRSDAQGRQFEFHCDKCGEGVRSSRVTSTMDLGSGLSGAAAALSGGLSSIGQNLKKELGGRGQDHAFAAAVREVKPKFTEREGLWLCKGCASVTEHGAACPCGAPAAGGRFCAACGKPMAAAPCPKCAAPIPAASNFCPGCGTPRL